MRMNKLILVYNAENGMFNAIADMAHKIFAPETYECTLCRYTYSVTGMLTKWKNFLLSLNCHLVFLYRQEFRDLYPDLDINFPAILMETERGIEMVLTANEIKACANLDELMAITRLKIDLNF